MWILVIYSVVAIRGTYVAYAWQPIGDFESITKCTNAAHLIEVNDDATKNPYRCLEK